MQHLVQLRRMILGRSNACMQFTYQGNRDSLYYGPDGFIGPSGAVSEKLCRIYQAEEGRVVQSPDSGQNMPRTSAVQAVVCSLRKYQLNREAQQRLHAFIRRFPPVAVKLAPLHRIGFEDFASYIHLHHQSLQTGHADLRRYLAEAGSDEEQLKRLRVFLAVFCLGLIVPTKETRRTPVRRQDARSVLSRIIQRVRGL